MHMIKHLRDILESQEAVREKMQAAGLPLSYSALLLDLRKTAGLTTGFRSLNLREVDDILLAYWAGRHTTEQLNLLKTALMKDDSTAMVFIKRLRDHERHMRTGLNGEKPGLPLDVLLKRGEVLSAAGPVFKKWVAVWLLPVAATLLIIFLLPKHSIYKDFNFDQDPPLMFQTDAQRNLRDYRSASSSTDSLFVNGMKAYLACDYEQALNLWSRHPAEGKYKRQLRLYSALSYIGLILSEKNKGKDNTKNISRAVELFNSVQGDMSGRERYFYAMALILAGQNAEARQQLSLIREPDMHARVQALSSYLD